MFRKDTPPFNCAIVVAFFPVQSGPEAAKSVFPEFIISVFNWEIMRRKRRWNLSDFDSTNAKQTLNHFVYWFDGLIVFNKSYQIENAVMEFRLFVFYANYPYDIFLSSTSMRRPMDIMLFLRMIANENHTAFSIWYDFNWNDWSPFES